MLSRTSAVIASFAILLRILLRCCSATSRASYFFAQWIVAPPNTNPNSAQATLDLLHDPLLLTPQVHANNVRDAPLFLLALQQLLSKANAKAKAPPKLLWALLYLSLEGLLFLAFYLLHQQLAKFPQVLQDAQQDLNRLLDKESQQDATSKSEKCDEDDEEKKTQSSRRVTASPKSRAPEARAQNETLPAVTVLSADVLAASYVLNPFSILSFSPGGSAAILPLAAIAYGALICVTTDGPSPTKVGPTKLWTKILSAGFCFGLYLHFHPGLHLWLTMLPASAALAQSPSVRLLHGRAKKEDLLKTLSICSLITAATLSSYLFIAALSFASLPLGHWKDFWDIECSYVMRQLSFANNQPNSGTYWLIMLLMFDSARPAFVFFFNIVTVIHALPLTIEYYRFCRYLLPYFLAITLMFANALPLIHWVCSVCLVSVYPEVLLQTPLGLLSIIAVFLGLALQSFVFDLWLTHDIANSTVAYMSCVIPHSVLVFTVVKALQVAARLNNQVLKDKPQVKKRLVTSY